MQLPPNNNVDESTRALSPKSPYQDLNNASQPVGDQMLTKIDKNTKGSSLNSPSNDLKLALKPVGDQKLPQLDESTRISLPNSPNHDKKQLQNLYVTKTYLN